MYDLWCTTCGVRLVVYDLWCTTCGVRLVVYDLWCARNPIIIVAEQRLCNQRRLIVQTDKLMKPEIVDIRRIVDGQPPCTYHQEVQEPVLSLRTRVNNGTK